MIDQNRDGLIDKDDLHDMFASLGWFIVKIINIYPLVVILNLFRIRIPKIV